MSEPQRMPLKQIFDRARKTKAYREEGIAIEREELKLAEREIRRLRRALLHIRSHTLYYHKSGVQPKCPCAYCLATRALKKVK